MRITFLAPLWLAASAFAGPFDQPYSIITTDPARSADPHVLPVIVNCVDDESVMRNRAIVAPGRHKVTVDVPPRKGWHIATQRTFDLETRPCVRYFVAARLDTLATQEWKPVVRSEERIGECEAKFNRARGQ